MGQRLSLHHDDTPFLLQLKSLNDAELLDFWEETQQVEHAMRCMMDHESLLALDYERLILMELQLRSCQRGRPV